MSQLSVHDIRGIAAYNNKIRVPQGHQLDIEGLMKLPQWTESSKPATPEVGLQGWNTETETLEFYDGTNWKALARSAIGTQDSPATSAAELVANGQTTDGVYWIKASSSAPAQQIYCILDPAYDGGGWMVVANNSASNVLYTSSHICRFTAYTSYVGSSGSDSHSPSNNFSINCTDIQFNKMVWVITNSNSNFIGSGGSNVNGYINFTWNNQITVPTEQPYWSADNGNNGFSMGATVSWPGFGAKRMNSSYGGYGQNSTNNYGFGTLHSSSYSTNRGTGTQYKWVGSGGAYYPATGAFQGSRANSGNTDALNAYSWTDSRTGSGSTYSNVGFDDWQDGSGLGDQWNVEGGDKSTTRGKPSFIMIK